MSREEENIVYLPLEGIYNKLEGKENTGTFCYYDSYKTASRNHPGVEIIEVMVVGWRVGQYVSIIGSV